MKDIYLRRLGFSDISGMLEWMHDEELVKWLKKDFTAMKENDCYQFVEDSRKESVHIHLAIADSYSDEYLGTVSLKNINFARRDAELGICLRRKCLGKRIGIRAWELIRNEATKVGIERIYLCVSVNNIRAIRFYEKNSFEEFSPSDVELEGYMEDGNSSLRWFQYFV